MYHAHQHAKRTSQHQTELLVLTTESAAPPTSYHNFPSSLNLPSSSCSTCPSPSNNFQSRCSAVGMIIYMPQEGRGIGLANKIKVYSMQELGFDTVDANRILGFADDVRDYLAVPSILSELKIGSVSLITNNPRKVTHLRQLGVKVTGRIPVVCSPTVHSERYIFTKQTRMQHNFTNI
jgi:GTP cyclohydrolase II